MEVKLEKFGRLAKEFHGESDRGCAILVMCVLEDCLRTMISALMPDPEAKLGRLAPAGSTTATIEVAQTLGMLSKRQADSFRNWSRFATGSRTVSWKG